MSSTSTEAATLSQFSSVLALPHGKTAKLEKVFSTLGCRIGKNPLRYALAVSVFYLALLPGIFLLKGDRQLLFFNVQTDYLKTFSLRSTHYYHDYEVGVKHFPAQRGLSLLEMPTSGSVMSVPVLREAKALEQYIRHNVTAVHAGQRYVSADVCSQVSEGGPCASLSAADLLASNDTLLAEVDGQPPEEVARRLVEQVDASMRPMLPSLVGAAGEQPPTDMQDARAVGQWLARTTALHMMMELRPGEATMAFESAVQEYVIDRAEGNTMRASVMLRNSLSSELVAMANSALILIGVTVVVMVGYVVFFVGSRTRIPGTTQIMLAASGTMIPGIASFAAFGLMGYVGIELNVLAVLVPFLGLAVGIDALFLITSAVTDAGASEMDTSELISKALAHSGVAYTVSTLTSVCAFLVSTFTTMNLPGFRVFSQGLVAVLVLNWVGMIFLLPALITLNEWRVRANRRDVVFCLRRKSDAQAGAGSALFQPSHKLRKFLSTTWPNMLESSYALPLIGAALWLGLLVFGAIRMPYLGRGMPDAYFLTDKSHVQVYLQDQDAAFGDMAPLHLPLLFEQPALGNASFRAGLASLLAVLAARSDVAMPPQCWLGDVAAQLQTNATDAEAAAAVDAYFASPASLMHGRDVVRDATGALDAALCSIHLWQPMDGERRAAQAADVRAMVDQARVPATVYHETFPIHAARYDAIFQLTTQAAMWCCLSVFMALLFTLPVHLALLVMLNVACVVLTLFAFMTVFGITCNAMSFTVTVMAIGFCVDYSCHVVHFTDHGIGHGMRWHKRVRSSLETCAYDVFQGCSTALLGVALLYWAPAEAFRMFGLMSIVITLAGGFFALWGLPAVLTLASKLQMHCAGVADDDCEAVPSKGGKDDVECCALPIPEQDTHAT